MPAPKFAMDVAEIREGAAHHMLHGRPAASAGPRRPETRRRLLTRPAAAAASSRCALEAHRAQARRDVDAARQEAARADRASNRLLLMLVLAAVGMSRR